MSSYNPSIPLVTDPMLKSQRQIRANFQAINTTFAQNHVQLNQPDQGQHDLLSLYHQVGDPNTTADQVSLYTKDVNSVPQLFYRPNNSQTAIQMTYSSISTGLQSTNPDVYLPTQYSFVAGPFVVHMGLISGATNGQLVTLTPATTLIYVCLTIKAKLNMPFNINTAACPKNIVGNQFNIAFASTLGTMDIYYTAIGL